MTITFYDSTSPKNKIGKAMTLTATYTGSLRAECSVTNPVFMIEADAILGNYFHVDAFGRYYFVKEVRAIRTGIWEVRGYVDVLESFKEAILAQTVILNDTSQGGADAYVNNDVYVTKVKKKTDIVAFPNGILDDGEFILITAGGIGGV